jgi:hypothetical protein
MSKAKSKLFAVSCLATLAVLGGVLTVVLLRRASDGVTVGTDANGASPDGTAHRASADALASPEAVTEGGVTSTVMVTGLTPADISALGDGKYIVTRGHQYFLADDEATKATATLDSLLDEGENADALKEAMRLKTHPNPDVRIKAAFALKWLGLEGLEGLTTMLVDPDPDVAEEANNYWKDMLNEIDSDYDKASLLVSAAQIYGKDVPIDILEDIVTELQMLNDQNTIAGLVELLKGVSDPERVQLIGDAINAMADEDSPDLAKEQRLRQAEEIARAIQEQEAYEVSLRDGTASPDTPLFLNTSIGVKVTR